MGGVTGEDRPRRARRRYTSPLPEPPRKTHTPSPATALEAVAPIIEQLEKENVGFVTGARAKTIRRDAPLRPLTRSLGKLDGAIGEVAEAVAGLTISFPPEVVDQIVERVTAQVLERLQGAKTAPAPEWLTTDQAAAYIGATSRDRIYKLVNARKLRPAKDGQLSKFRRADLDAYLEGRHKK